jgi:hypothetical protein
LFDKDKVLNDHLNNAGYAKIGDNYIKSDIWSTDVAHIISDYNSFSYEPGSTVVSTAPQPHELSLDLKSGSTSLDASYTLSSLPGKKYIQFINVSTPFNLEATISNAGTSADSYYIIRPNGNFNGVTTTSEAHVLSNENYFYDSESIENGSAITRSITYDKPGLYGIDVIGFDAHDYGGSTGIDFRASSWQHIPVIVKGTQDKILYFNIKDSFKKSVSSTGVRKQAYFNNLLIWEEDIAVGGNGWEYVAIDLTGVAANGSTNILDSLHTDGTDNVLSFSVYMDASIPSAVVSGVTVWVDDVYIPKSGSIIGSSTGDNLVRDGSMELSTDGLCAECY